MQVQVPPHFGVLGQDDEHALQPLEAFAPGLTGTPGNRAANLAAAAVLAPVLVVVPASHCSALQVHFCIRQLSSKSCCLCALRCVFGFSHAGAQPFSLYVSPAAELVMDFHAHLCQSEVIGVLAGVYDPTNRTVRCSQGGSTVQTGRSNLVAPKARCMVETKGQHSCMTVHATPSSEACWRRALCVKWTRRTTPQMLRWTQQTSGRCGSR